MKTLKTIGFWLVQCTWGIVMTSIGALVTLVLIICGRKPKTLGPVVYTTVGDWWGGLELGGFFICCKQSENGTSTRLHEAGHGLQNMIWGPLFPFVIGLPSAARYWVRNFHTQEDKNMFALCLFFITFALTIGLTAMFGFWLKITWLAIITGALAVYSVILFIWLAGFEIPKYATKTPLYDDMWFEGQASRWGEKYFSKYLEK